ncbi:MAG: hypothetical protein IPH04_09440, partial [Saprospirales bacterium]|nr:hypothetical protein [Saprospirales bacterium]
KNEAFYLTMTDLDGLAIIGKEVKNRLNLIKISYVGFDTLEIPIEGMNGNVITVKLELGKPLETLVREIHDIQLRVKKSDQGILVKWPYDEKFREWFHSDKWKDEDCY